MFNSFLFKEILYKFQNALLITTPEDSLTLIAPSACDKMDWLHAFQDALKKRLNKNPVPTTRIASYTFTKHATYKDAKYTGNLSLFNS